MPYPSKGDHDLVDRLLLHARHEGGVAEAELVELNDAIPVLVDLLQHLLELPLFHVASHDLAEAEPKIRLRDATCQPAVELVEDLPQVPLVDLRFRLLQVLLHRRRAPPLPCQSLGEAEEHRCDFCCCH